MKPFGEIGANFSLQISSRTQFAKISNKKVIAENQCEKHKNKSLIQFSDNFCCLQITFANSLDPDQYLHNFGLDLDPNCLTLL